MLGEFLVKTKCDCSGADLKEDGYLNSNLILFESIVSIKGSKIQSMGTCSVLRINLPQHRAKEGWEGETRGANRGGFLIYNFQIC